MNNWIKKHQIALVVGVGVGFWYYFGVHLPKENAIEVQKDQQEFLLTKKAQCQAAGEKVHSKMEAEKSADSTMFVALYAFNEELNTCLYRSGILSVSDGKSVRIMWVMDVYTQKELLTHSSIDNEPVFNYLTVDEFNSQADELMGL